MTGNFGRGQFNCRTSEIVTPILDLKSTRLLIMNIKDDGLGF